MNPCTCHYRPTVTKSLRAFSTGKASSSSSSSPSSRTLSTRIQPGTYFQEDEFPMKLTHYIQKRSDMHQQHLQHRWTSLARLTLDPSIANVSHSFNKNTLPTSITQVMADRRPSMILDGGDSFTIVNVNQALCQYSGYLRDEVLNQKLSTLLYGPESNMEHIESMVEKAQYGLTPSGLVTLYTRDGRKRDEMMRLATIAIGGDVSSQYVVCVLDRPTRQPWAAAAGIESSGSIIIRSCICSIPLFHPIVACGVSL
eukprot:scaffold3015_cov122-Cylindrotheca_fusiformis.AAC.3